MGMLKWKFSLREGCTLRAALRVNAAYDCLDDVLDFGDHFASNPTNASRTSAGGGEIFFLKNF